MKIKIDKLRVDHKNESFEVSNITLEISTKEILEMNKTIENTSPHHISPMSPFKLYYRGSLAEIREEDFVDILPSENCVTNSDKIKYDEVLSGIKGKKIVEHISVSKNEIRIKTLEGIFNVHSHWLSLYARGK